MHIVFFGTPPFAASILAFLIDAQVQIAAVVTQPDKPKGRSLQLAPSAVKELLLSQKISCPLFQPNKCSEPAFLEEMRRLQPDLFVVVAFGQILPQQLLDIPAKGAINVHASLLPKYRGAAPIQRALMNGDQETGVVIQKMVKQLDAGDKIAVVKTEISPAVNAGELQDILCELSKPLLLLVLQAFEEGIPHMEPQDPSLVTYAAKIAIEEGEIHWNEPAEKIHNLVRAFAPRPGAWCFFDHGGERRRVKILETEVLHRAGEAGKFFPGEPVIGCGYNSLKINKIQTEGKKVVSGAEWLRGFFS